MEQAPRASINLTPMAELAQLAGKREDARSYGMNVVIGRDLKAQKKLRLGEGLQHVLQEISNHQKNETRSLAKCNRAPTRNAQMISRPGS